MATTERISISVNKERAERIRQLVRSGTFPNISAAYDAATNVLITHLADKEGWWQETLRRCDEAERHPEKMLDPDEFFRTVRAGIQYAKDTKAR